MKGVNSVERNMPDINESLEYTQNEIKFHLKQVLPEDIYDTWVDNFVIEKIDSNSIVVGYYGSEPLKKFNKEYKETVWMHICSVVGFRKNLKIHKATKNNYRLKYT